MNSPFMYPGNGAFQIFQEVVKRASCRSIAEPDEHVIPTGLCNICQRQPSSLSETTFRAISGDRIADFFRTGEALSLIHI